MQMLNYSIQSKANTDIFILLTIFSILKEVNTLKELRASSTGERNKVFDSDFNNIVAWLGVKKEDSKENELRRYTCSSLINFNSIVSQVANATGYSVKYIHLQYIIYQATFMPITLKEL
jgi:hypothetical protein